MSDWSDTGTRRTTLAVAGFLAGLATWLLVDALPDRTDNARLILVLAVAAAGLFGTFLATAGPLKPWPASLAALGLALLTSLSMLATSFHFDDVDDYFETGHPIAALFILLTIPQPFFLAGLKPGGRFLSYPNLFEEAWELVVRVSAALVFVGAVWLIIYLSDLLFGLVGLDIIEDLLEIDSVPFLITGLALGVALAAAFELREVMGPDLAIRLIRLLLPILLVVTAVFLVALPFRGLSGLFGDLSAASTLMAMTVTSATLVTSAVDRRDETAARAPILIISARILAALVSALGVLAVIAVALRVQQYGWTPNRLAAMTGALISAGYGAFYLLAVLTGGRWKEWLRTANVTMALVTIAVAFVWLTPAFNPQSISASSQLARFESGQTSVEELDLWEIGREWGRPGMRVIERLEMLDHPDAERLSERLAALEEATSSYAFENAAPPQAQAEDLSELEARLDVFPLRTGRLDRIVAGLRPHDVEQWLEACDRRTPKGHAGCAVLLADLVPTLPGDEALIFLMASENSLRIEAMLPDADSDGFVRRAPTGLGNGLQSLRTPDTLDALHDGLFSVAPAPMNAFEVHGNGLIVIP